MNSLINLKRERAKRPRARRSAPTKALIEEILKEVIPERCNVDSDVLSLANEHAQWYAKRDVTRCNDVVARLSRLPATTLEELLAKLRSALRGAYHLCLIDSVAVDLERFVKRPRRIGA